MKKYSIILLILTGMSTVVFAQDIKVAEKSEENQTTKGNNSETGASCNSKKYSTFKQKKWPFSFYFLDFFLKNQGYKKRCQF